MNANTDHSSILFDVDLNTGEIKAGTTNAHWYQIGVQNVLTTPWLPPRSDIRQHIDYPYPTVAGKFVPDIQSAVDIVVRYDLFFFSSGNPFNNYSLFLLLNSSHFKMMPEVPIVGWDVAFTNSGIYLLEVLHIWALYLTR
jgi:hypothetical protein